MSKNVAGSDAGIGRAVFTTRLQLTMQAVRMCFWFGLVPGLLLPFFLWATMVSDQDFDIVKLSLVAELTGSQSYSTWKIRNSEGVRQTVVAVTKDGKEADSLTPGQLRRALAPKWEAVRWFHLVLWLCLLGGALGFTAAWYWIRRLGSESQKNRRIRGAHAVLPWVELNARVRRTEKVGWFGGPNLYSLAKVSLPKSAPVAGILLQGAQRSGKSLAMQNLMAQVFARKKKCIIYDQSGDLYKAHFRPGKDVFFNPGLTGSVPWSIFSEMKYVYDANTLAQAFLPPKGGIAHGASAFFEDAARALFSVILLRLAQNGAQNTSDIAKAFLEMPDDEMESLIANSIASSAIGGDSKGQRQGVISSISIYLDGIAAVEHGSWSIREFIEQDDDSRLFILGTEDTAAMFAPLYRLVLAIAFAVIASKQEAVFDDKYWFFLDECHTLGDIKLDDKLATLGKYGVAIVAGVQSESQFMTSVGQERGQTVMNCFNTVLMLRMNEPSMMERAAKRLGMQDMETVSQNQALAVAEWRDGAGMARTQQERWLVMPSEFGSLAACQGFIKLSADYPTGRVDYADWISKPWIGRNYADSFRPRQDTPPRNPKFLLERGYPAGSVDPIAVVSQKLQDGKNAEAAQAAAAANSPAAPGIAGSVTAETGAVGLGATGSGTAGSGNAGSGNATRAASAQVSEAGGAPKGSGRAKTRLRLVPTAEPVPANSAAAPTSRAATQSDLFEGGLTGGAPIAPMSTGQELVATHLRDTQQRADGANPLPSKDLGDRDFERLDF